MRNDKYVLYQHPTALWHHNYKWSLHDDLIEHEFVTVLSKLRIGVKVDGGSNFEIRGWWIV